MKFRKIRFRIWFSKTKKWIYGPGEEVNLLGEMILLGEFMRGISIADLNHCKIMQFTGLIDKSGKEIYEGDILSDSKETKKLAKAEKIAFWERAIVKYYPEFARFGLEFYSVYGGEGYTGKEQHISDYVATGSCVIGNIFENPKLLK